MTDSELTSLSYKEFLQISKKNGKSLPHKMGKNIYKPSNQKHQKLTNKYMKNVQIH